MTFVLDASVAMTWCFEDETTERSRRLLHSFRDGAVAMVPAIWSYEIANVVATAVRRGRLAVSAGASFLQDLHDAPIEVDAEAGAHLPVRISGRNEVWLGCL